MYAKYGCTMIGPGGLILRWTALRKIIQRVLNINDFLSDKANLKAEAHAPQRTTAGPYHANPTSLHFLSLVPCVASVLAWFASTLSASRPASELPRVRTRSTKGLRRSRQLEGMILLLFLRSPPTGRRNFLLLPWLAAPRNLPILYVTWTAMANLMISHRIRNRRLPQPYYATHYIDRISLDRSAHGLPRFWDRSVVFKLWRFCLT